MLPSCSHCFAIVSEMDVELCNTDLQSEKSDMREKNQNERLHGKDGWTVSSTTVKYDIRFPVFSLVFRVTGR